MALPPRWRCSVAVVQRSGDGQAGRWVVERVDVLADAIRAFGSERPTARLLAVASDTDNTGERARAGFADLHFVAREAIVSVQDDELGNVRMQNVVPRFSATPGEVRSAGPALGAHNDEVWTELGFTSQQIALMRERKVI
jgi:crotonobetainyl-CoA:carnitine CoA-transferase CaiB-like acyl-CoA transferase